MMLEWPKISLMLDMLSCLEKNAAPYDLETEHLPSLY